MQQSLEISSIADEILSCPHFRIAIKQIVEEMSDTQKSKEASTIDSESCLEGIIEEIGEHMEVMIREQAEKQLRISQQLVRQFYELKRKQFHDEMEAKIDKELTKIKEQISQQLERLENHKITEISFNQSMEKNQSKSRIKRSKIKEMILSSETSFDDKKTEITEPNSPIPVDLQSQFGKLSRQLTEMREEVNRSLKTLNERIKCEQAKNQQRIERVQSSFKEQLEGNFEGIWNIISNLEKRMLDRNSEEVS